MNLQERAAVIPGRSLTRSKAIFGLHCTHGEGPYLYGANGKKYIDMLCALGAVSLGYRPCDEVKGGSMSGVYSLPHFSEVEAAETILKHVAPWASSVRFTKTGSEATHAAYRIARAATGRRSVLVGDWAYHGWHEWCADVDPFNQIVHGEIPPTWLQPAAVMIEPHRWAPVKEEWLKALRVYCDQVGALLVFDSMIYGGRFALGGASEYFGVTPDLECFGKAIGNGQAIACVVGRDALATHGEMVSGTYSGEAIALMSVCDVVREYVDCDVVRMLWALGERLANGLEILVSGTSTRREGAPVHQRLAFLDPDTGVRFSREMLKRGVIWHPGCTNVMAAHTPAIIDEVLNAAEDSLKALAS